MNSAAAQTAKAALDAATNAILSQLETRRSEPINRTGGGYIDVNGHRRYGNAATDNTSAIDLVTSIINTLHSEQRLDQEGTTNASLTGTAKGLQASNEQARKDAEALANSFRYYYEYTKRWNEEQERATKELEQQSRLAQELGKSFDEMEGKSLFGDSLTKRGSAGASEAQKYLDELAKIREKGTEQLDEENIQLQVSNGTLSQHAAALQLAALHARQYS